MINTLYSLLVSGAGDIPDTFEHYRRYTPIVDPVYGIPVHGNPHSQALWANYIIALSRLSPLYPSLRALDPINTYDECPRAQGRAKISDGCSIISVSSTNPVLKDVYSVSYTTDQDSTHVLVTSSDGMSTISAVPASDSNDMYIVDIQGYKIKFNSSVAEISVDIYNQSVPLYGISKSDIARMYKYIPAEVYQSMDMDSVYDRACAFSIAILLSYRSI